MYWISLSAEYCVLKKPKLEARAPPNCPEIRQAGNYSLWLSGWNNYYSLLTMQRMPVWGSGCGSKVFPPEINIFRHLYWEVPWHRFDKMLPNITSLELDCPLILILIYLHFLWSGKRLHHSSNPLDLKLTKQRVHEKGLKLCHHVDDYRQIKGESSVCKCLSSANVAKCANVAPSDPATTWRLL